jgi:hypothetical protein
MIEDPTIMTNTTQFGKVCVMECDVKKLEDAAEAVALAGTVVVTLGILVGKVIDVENDPDPVVSTTVFVCAMAVPVGVGD